MAWSSVHLSFSRFVPSCTLSEIFPESESQLLWDLLFFYALLAGRSLVEQAPEAAVTRAIGRVVEAVRPELAASATRTGRRSRGRRLGLASRRARSGS